MASHDSETPAIHQQVITACAFIHRRIDGIPRVLLGKRATTKKFLPGNYELLGGHIEWGEDIVAGLKREVREELGVDIAVANPFAAFTYVNEIKGSHSIEVIYFATLISPPDQITIDPEDHSEIRWVDKAVAVKLTDMSPEEHGVLLKGLLLLDNLPRSRKPNQAPELANTPLQLK